MRKFYLLSTLLIFFNVLYSQIPKVRTDTVRYVSNTLPPKDLTPAYLINPGFEDGLLGWTATGNAFTQIVGGNMISSERVRTEMLYENGGIGGDYWKNMAYPVGAKGQRWIGSFERGNGDAATGSLTSEPFKMTRQFLHFLLGGGKDVDKLYVELQIKGTVSGAYGTTPDGYSKVKKITPEINSEELFRYQFNIVEITGRSIDSIRKSPPTARIVIVDLASAGPFGHINVDDFTLSDCVGDFLAIQKQGKLVYADKDKPVWGFVDTHTHPMAHLAFGGKTMTGDPDGPMDVALATSQCVDNNHQPGNGLGFIGIQVYNWHLPYGYPTFSGWPKFNVQLHQPMYIDWIKRSFEGGLKLISVLGVTNMFWASRALGPGVKPDLPIDDESVALLAIQEFKKIVDKNSDWMEVALTPQDARRIILSNKLAVVLGVEMDNFGNFKDASYVFREPYSIPPSKPLNLLAPDNNQINLNNARVQIQNKIKEYYDLGVRQVTPLHYITGVFGGTAVFRYQFGMIQSSFTGKPYLLNDGRAEGVNYNINKDIQTFQTILGSAWEYLSGDVKAFYTCKLSGWTDPDPFSNFCENVYSTVNGHGMFPRGKILYEELMKQGFVIDVDHTSRLTSSQLFVLAKSKKYPLLSSHTDPSETCLGPRRPLYINADIKWGDDAEWNYKYYGTTAIGNLSTEFTPTKLYYQNIASSGGMAGLFTFPFRKDNSVIANKSVANDCDGSSKSWAQNYLYAIETMPGKGIGLATDKGFTEAVGPRFGVMASYKLIEEKTDYLNKVLRTQQRMAQDNAVKYDIPFQDWNPRRFEMGSIETFADGIFEEDLWKALAFWQTHPDIRTAKPQEHPQYNEIPPSQYLVQTDRVKNLVTGLAITDAANLLPTGLLSGADQPWQQAIAYCFSHNKVPGDLPREKYAGLYLNLVQEKYERWKPVYVLWQRMMNGTNEPLRKLVNGNRDWDYNIDGMAHYGMIPDFIQDLKNVGIRADQMIPLFSSAEEYIRMWEKADSAAGKKVVCNAASSTITKNGCNSYTSPSGKYTWTTSGTYKDTIQNTSCCDSIITINLTIIKVDTAVISQPGVLTAKAQNATYQWINCSTNERVPNATGATLSIASGNYAVNVTQNGCTAISSCYSILPLAVTPPINLSSLPFQKFSGSRKIVADDRKNNSEFGRAVSISGKYAVVGVPYERADANNQNEMSQSGAAYIFEKINDSTWKQVQKIVASDRTSGDHFGWSVGISGNYIVVGAVYDREDAAGNNMGTSAGSAYIFEKNSNNAWRQVKKIGPTPWDSYSYFGGAVAIEGNTIVVGAVGHSKDTTENGTGYVGDGGAVFVFEGSGSNWNFTQKLLAKDRTQLNHGENFGNSVSISGNYIIAGAWGSRFDENNANLFESAGAAYIFERSGGRWIPVQKIVASDRTAYDEFGYSVAVSGDNAIVGARRTTLTTDEDNNGYTGTGYIFSRDQSGKWKETLKIIPADRKSGDLLGVSVAMNGELAAISASNADSISPNEGAVYIYRLADGKWTQVQKLWSSNHGGYSGLGISVAICEGNVIAGAAIEDTDLQGKNSFSNAGAAYIFMQPPLKTPTNPLIRN
jgi:hypothetical protein